MLPNESWTGTVLLLGMCGFAMLVIAAVCWLGAKKDVGKKIEDSAAAESCVPLPQVSSVVVTTPALLVIALADVVRNSSTAAAIAEAAEAKGFLHNYYTPQSCEQIVEEAAVRDGVLAEWIIDTTTGHAASVSGEACARPERGGYKEEFWAGGEPIVELDWTGHSVLRCVCPSLVEVLKHRELFREFSDLAWHSPYTDGEAWNRLESLLELHAVEERKDKKAGA